MNRERLRSGLARLTGGIALTIFAFWPQSAHCISARDARHRSLRWRAHIIAVQVVSPRPSVGLADADVLQAAQRAARGWAAPAVPSIAVALSKVARTAWEDGVSTITLRDDGWRSASNPENCYDPRQLAITHPYSRALNPRAGVAEVIEADIEINANNTYFASVSLDEKKTRLQAVLTHEFGHLLGLDHNCSATRLSTTAQGPGEERPLCSDDEERIREEAMFPGLSDPTRAAVLEPTAGELACASAFYGNGWLDAVSLSWARSRRAAIAMFFGVLLLALGRAPRRSRGSVLAAR